MGLAPLAPLPRVLAPGLLYLFARHIETGDETLQLERATAAAAAAAADADAVATDARPNPVAASAAATKARDETFDDLRRRMLEIETFLPLLREQQRRRRLDAKEAERDATDGGGEGVGGNPAGAREEVEGLRRAGRLARWRSRVATWVRRGGRRVAED